MIDEVTSDLVRDTYSKRKSITWFTSSHEGDESTDLFLNMDFSEQRKGWRQNFFLLPRGRGVMAIMVGSFTLQLPTSASVATSLAFAKPWHYRMFGGNFFTFGGYWRCEVN